MCRPFEHVFEVFRGGGGFVRVGECGYDILSKVPFWDLFIVILLIVVVVVCVHVFIIIVIVIVIIVITVVEGTGGSSHHPDNRSGPPLGFNKGHVSSAHGGRMREIGGDKVEPVLASILQQEEGVVGALGDAQPSYKGIVCVCHWILYDMILM